MPCGFSSNLDATLQGGGDEFHQLMSFNFHLKKD